GAIRFPGHVYDHPGHYTVTVSVQAQNGLGDTKSAVLDVLNSGPPIQVLPVGSPLHDVAQNAGGEVFAATATGIVRLDAATGPVLNTLTSPGGGGTKVGLQVLPSSMNLAGTSVPAGSLLVFNGELGKVFAVNPNTGATIATLDTVTNAVAGAFDPDLNELFFL